MNVEFRAWPKIPRLNREIVITEKIDGTNAAVIVFPLEDYDGAFGVDDELNLTEDGVGIHVTTAQDDFVVVAQSRKRIISPGKQSDNAGFAGWVRENALELATALGHGYHYGEWWGKGVQHGYGQESKRFSLFNVARYGEAALPEGVDCVPLLWRGPFSQNEIQNVVDQLRTFGSVAAPGQKAEGVVVFHEASGQCFKVLCENDQIPKGNSETERITFSA